MRLRLDKLKLQSAYQSQVHMLIRVCQSNIYQSSTCQSEICRPCREKSMQLILKSADAYFGNLEGFWNVQNDSWELYKQQQDEKATIYLRLYLQNMQLAAQKRGIMHNSQIIGKAHNDRCDLRCQLWVVTVASSGIYDARGS